MKKHWRTLAAWLPAAAQRNIYEAHFKKEHTKWEALGTPFPPSHLLKQKKLLRIAKQYHLSVLVETGTFLGDMVFAMEPHFKTIYSIELSKEFHAQAQKRFRNSAKVRLVFGDSAKKLKEVVAELNEPALFWLDGHYSGGTTAKGDKECPVYEELESIFSSSLHHVIIIDDARLFIGKNDYPTFPELTSFVKGYHAEATLSIENDSILITLSTSSHV
ncbi:MAG: hypothetical protein JWP69_911 [Flaviaesturariibacter sp.]|nr:hypothetical protein [Flaviaesturariibacter sp.]